MVLIAQDLRLARDAGVKGCILSNHGGRQLDRARAGFDSLRRIREQDPEILQQLEVYVDGGARRGTDVLMALALGAKGVGMGRPFLYAQAAYGEKGAIRAVRSRSLDSCSFLKVRPGTEGYCCVGNTISRSDDPHLAADKCSTGTRDRHCHAADGRVQARSAEAGNGRVPQGVLGMSMQMLPCRALPMYVRTHLPSCVNADRRGVLRRDSDDCIWRHRGYEVFSKATLYPQQLGVTGMSSHTPPSMYTPCTIHFQHASLMSSVETSNGHITKNIIAHFCFLLSISIENRSVPINDSYPLHSN